MHPLHLVTKPQQDSKPKKAQIPHFDVVGFFSVLGVPVHLENDQNINLSTDFYKGNIYGISVSQLWYRERVPASFGRLLP